MFQQLELLGIWISGCHFKNNKNEFLVFNLWTWMLLKVPYNHDAYFSYLYGGHGLLHDQDIMLIHELHDDGYKRPLFMVIPSRGFTEPTLVSYVWNHRPVELF